MSAGRRGLLMSVPFFALVLWLCPAQRAAAQPGGQPQRLPDPNAGRHSIWKRDLHSDTVRDLLGKFGKAGDADPFEDLLRKMLRDRNPDVPPEQVDAAAKRFMNDKEFRDRVVDLAQRVKNRDGAFPKDARDFNRDDLDKLVKVAPKNIGNGNGGNGGDPFQLPKFDPMNPPKFDPMNPPKFDPMNPPKFDPMNPPKFDPMNPPKLDPLQPPPKVDPKDAPNNDGKRRFDPDNPLGQPNDTPEKMAKTKAVEAATALWEKNVGPIDESPAVRRALIDLISDNDMMEALTDSKGRNIFEMFENGGDGDGFGKLFEGGEGGGWEWPKFEFNWGRDRDNNFDFGNRRDRAPDWGRDRDTAPRSRSSTSLDGLGTFSFGGAQVPWLLLVILLAVIVAAVVWWKWKDIVRPRAARAGPAGPMPWPLDPRDINSREDVVRAFEYLSVLICGPGAKTWTHSTIADELSALVKTHGATAVKLARLYELARYAPLDEPLTRDELLEARRLVCDLAGMDAA
ncbi:MAG: hypothetical protein FJ304_09440 [Planctomycetes bacterium]|nr:hypothetical protein [Planctomycetota bacterium]